MLQNIKLNSKNRAKQVKQVSRSSPGLLNYHTSSSIISARCNRHESERCAHDVV